MSATLCPLLYTSNSPIVSQSQSGRGNECSLLRLESSFPYVPADRQGDDYRLDAMHNAIAAYVGSSISFEPLGSPKRILEVGGVPSINVHMGRLPSTLIELWLSNWKMRYWRMVVLIGQTYCLRSSSDQCEQGNTSCEAVPGRGSARNRHGGYARMVRSSQPSTVMHDHSILYCTDYQSSPSEH